MEDPSITRVIDTRDYAQPETAFSFHILWIYAHAYAMRQRRVLDDNEWAGWLQLDEELFSKRNNRGDLETDRIRSMVQSSLSEILKRRNHWGETTIN